MEIATSAKSFFVKSVRVWRTLKKPTMDEFVKVSKISALGVLVIGAIGFLISIILGIFF